METTNINTRRNIIIGAGVVVIILVLIFTGNKLSGKNKVVDDNVVTKVAENMIQLQGKATASYEGANTLNYNFVLPESATSTMTEEGDLIKVIDNDGVRATVYFSYEGARGISPLDYIGEIVAPHLSVINVTNTETIGNYEWQLAETNGSNWYVSSLNNGEWIVAIEVRKTFYDQGRSLVESFKAE